MGRTGRSRVSKAPGGSRPHPRRLHPKVARVAPSPARSRREGPRAFPLPPGEGRGEGHTAGVRLSIPPSPAAPGTEHRCAPLHPGVMRTAGTCLSAPAPDSPLSTDPEFKLSASLLYSERFCVYEVSNLRVDRSHASAVSMACSPICNLSATAEGAAGCGKATLACRHIKSC